MAENLGNMEGNENETDEVFSSPMDFVTVNRAAKRKKQGSGNLEPLDQPSTSNAYSHHTEPLTVRIRGVGFNIAKLGPLEIAKEVGKITRSSVKSLGREGTELIVYCYTYRQAKTLLGITEFCKKTVTVKNTSEPEFKGVISGISVDLDDDKKKLDEIKESTKRQGVTFCKRLNRRDKDGKLVPTRTILLFFRANKLPESIKLGYEQIPVRAYSEQVVRCYKCQIFGHVAKHCRSSKVRCPRCSEEHTFQECDKKSETPKCANCGGPHSAAYKGCPKYAERKEILKVKTEKKISFADAVKQVQNKTTAKTQLNFTPLENDQQKEKVEKKVEEKKEERKVMERENPSTHKQDVAVETVDDEKRFPSSSNDDFANFLAFLAKTLQIINTERNDDIIYWM